MSGQTDTPQTNEKAAPFAAGRPDIETLEGNQMHYNLTADDYDVEIGELIEQYQTAASRGFGIFNAQRFAYDGHWEATIHVDARFSGDQVMVARLENGPIYSITGTGSDLCEALRNVRNHFVAAAPVEIAKGA